MNCLISSNEKAIPFSHSYLIQNFVNKVNTKFWNDFQVIFKVFWKINFQVERLWECVFVKKGFAQVAQAHISQDGSVFKGLQQELINSNIILSTI